jgi:hypothetical protein
MAQNINYINGMKSINQSINIYLITQSRVQVGQVKIMPHLLTMCGFVVCAEKLSINLIKWWRGML